MAGWGGLAQPRGHRRQHVRGEGREALQAAADDVSDGPRPRRAVEMALFRAGNYRAKGDAVPIWRTDGKGRLRGIIRQMQGSALIGWLDGTPRPPVTAPRP